ncbi:MAG: glycosyltransferase family 2 protein [Candidatus Bathyarchaeota archaeon]|nr:glycosyltransferase family 2 protein [Candidatus Bathyarchaeota archaeon]
MDRVTLSNKPLVSIIILNFNGQNYLYNCISSVLESNYSNFEVILVDNASTDQSVALLENAFGKNQRLKIVRNSENLGFSAGNNVGFRFASGDYVVFLNNDTVVDSQWLTNVIDVLENDVTIGLAQSMLLEIAGSAVQSAGVLYADYLLRGFSIGVGVAATTEFPEVFEVSFAVGAAMIIKRTLIEQIGLFEPIVPFYYDDTLLSFKVWLAGKRVVTVSTSKVYHKGGDATKSVRSPFKVLNELKANVCLLFDCYYSKVDLGKALFVFSVASSQQFLSYLSRKQPDCILAQVKGVMWSLRNIGAIWRNRVKHWNNPKISDAELFPKFIRISLPRFGLNLAPHLYRKRFYEASVKRYERTLGLN